MRIIAGSARGRSIEVPKGRDTRPTLDRVREAIFGMIQFDIEDSIVLDLFGGSGALGLEALSRGASHAVFCDSDRSACAVIEKNLNSLGFYESAEVHCSDCFALIKRLSSLDKKFSLILIDPPYRAGLYEGVLEELISCGIVSDGCILILEHPKKMALGSIDPRFSIGKPHSYGDVAVTKLVYRDPDASQL